MSSVEARACVTVVRWREQTDTESEITQIARAHTPLTWRTHTHFGHRTRGEGDVEYRVYRNRVREGERE